jgi:hypothetical protein
MAIGYQNVRVSKAKLEKLERERDLEKGPKRFGKYKAWLHFANLDMWQKQGHHFHYLTDVSGGKQKLLCTCGLFMEDADSQSSQAISSDLALRVGELLLDRLQALKGHKNLDDFRGLNCALIVDLAWNEVLNRHLWTAYCQECGDFVVEKENIEARGFVSLHNANCLVSHE